MLLRMRNWVRRVRERLSYANVVATLALFVALGGTSYALTLPRNSVGSKQLRTNSIGRSEIKRGAVNTRAIKNQSIRLRDVSRGTRNALRGTPGLTGPQGPPGFQLFAAVSSGGVIHKGNANYTRDSGPNGRVIGFNRHVGDCVATATLAFVPGGGVETPPPGHVTVAPTDDGKVLVRTWNSSGDEVFLPFNLIVAC
jgi:hypothetical protein